MTFSHPPSYKSLRLQLQAFNEERDWAQFHSPKNLVMALVSEAGELNKIYQIMGDNERVRYDFRHPVYREIADEIADVLSFLINLADKLNIVLKDPSVFVRRSQYSDKSQVMMLVTAVALLNEPFQWLTEEASYTASAGGPLRDKVLPRVKAVQLALHQLAWSARINPLEALVSKIQRNAAKYPAEKVRGRADKYDTY